MAMLPSTFMATPKSCSPPPPPLLSLSGPGSTVGSSLHAGHAPHKYQPVSQTDTLADTH